MAESQQIIHSFFLQKVESWEAFHHIDEVLKSVANRCYENVAQLKYLGMTATNQNTTHEEIKIRYYFRMPDS
jgi:hypothetical protein